MSNSLIVNEIFFSIQGESTHAGEPCGFIRLAHCDLRCAWCDTEYAFYEGKKMSIDQIVEKICSFPSDLIEITGGEPLLQNAVHELTRTLIEKGKKVLIETGGHRDITLVDPRAKLIYDIKCPDSGMSERILWENLNRLRPQDEIKFVLASRQDYDWAKETLERHPTLREHTLLFSPVWETLPPADLAGWVLEDGLSVRLQLQLHKILWGNQRGT